MTHLIDISVSLHEGLPVWPGSHGVHISSLLDMQQGDEANVTRLDIDIHSGTHIDAPRHFLPDGKTTDAIPLDVLVGLCQVVDLRGRECITARDLEELDLPAGTERLLFRTDNSRLWEDPGHRFRTDYCALTLDAAEWVAGSGIRLVGIDYHSIQRFHDPADTHVVLLEREIVILEGLDLRQVEPGPYRLWCLPIKLKGVEGASARAVLEPLARNL